MTTRIVKSRALGLIAQEFRQWLKSLKEVPSVDLVTAVYMEIYNDVRAKMGDEEFFEP